MKRKNIEINEKFEIALGLMNNTHKNVFITGKAGTGKSTLLDYFRSNTKKRIVVLAPTGVAAINVQGETIHSFFGFKPDITLQKVEDISAKRARIYKNLDAIVIDEISMVRADLLDCVDRFLRLNGKHRNLPFGGIQMIFIGDLYQLPPVVTSKEREVFRTQYQNPYFFGANIFEELSMEFVELEKVYRQTDNEFIGLLNSIRNNSITEEGLSVLNSRVGAIFSKESGEGRMIHLTTLNRMADEINKQHLLELDTKICTYEAEILGDFKENSYPSEYELNIGIGAQVMLLNNDSKGRWVNGTLGEIIDIKKGSKDRDDIIVIKLADSDIVEVSPFTWEIFHFTFNDRAKTIEADSVGSFTQYPLRLAWAITIHKSQGKTFDRVAIDIGNGTFAHGQVYVALSRCTSFEGITLAKPIKKSHIFMDWRIVKFMTKYQYTISEQNMSLSPVS